MKISSALLKPHLNELQDEFEELRQQIGFEASLQALELKTEIEKHLKEIAKLKASAVCLELQSEALVPADLYATYKEMKLNLRFAKRIWERLISNQHRIKKMQEKRNHVAIFAA